VGLAPPFLLAEVFCANVRDIFEIIYSAVQSFLHVFDDREEIMTSLKFCTYVIWHELYITGTIMVGQAPPYRSAALGDLRGE